MVEDEAAGVLEDARVPGDSSSDPRFTLILGAKALSFLALPQYLY